MDKRALLVQTALTLFYERGVNSVGINEILKVSGIAKKTLYAYFDSKEALVIAALQMRDDRFLQWLETELANADTPEASIERLFHSLTAWFHNQVDELDDFRGCLFIKTSAQCSDIDGEIFQYCQAHKQRVRSLLARHLECSDKTLDLICLLKEGAIVTAHLQQDLQAAENSLPLALMAYEDSVN